MSIATMMSRPSPPWTSRRRRRARRGAHGADLRGRARRAARGRARPPPGRPRARPARGAATSRRRAGARRAADEPPVSGAQERDGARPGGAVVLSLLGAQLRAEETSSARSPTTATSPWAHTDKPVGVEVVAQQDRGVGIGRREEPRSAVVEEVALVDGLEAGRSGPRRASRHRRLVALLLGPERRRPEALSRAASSAIVAQMPTSAGEEVTRRLHRRVDLGLAVRGRDEEPRTGTARRRRPARAGAGTRRRSARCRSRPRPRSSSPAPRGRRGRHRAHALHADRLVPGRGPQARLEPRPRLLQPRVHGRVAEPWSVANAAAVASGFPESVPAWYRAHRGELVHDLRPAAEGRERQPAAGDLAEDGQVGPTP